MEQFSGFVVSFWFAAGDKIIRLFRSCCFGLQLGPQPGSGFWIFETWPQWSNSYIVFEVFEISICSWGQNYPCVLKFWGFDLELRSQSSCLEVLSSDLQLGPQKSRSFEVLRFPFSAPATTMQLFWGLRFLGFCFELGPPNSFEVFEVKTLPQFRWQFTAVLHLLRFWGFWSNIKPE